MRRKYLFLGLLLVLCCCLSACQLLPEEEAPKTAPLLRTYTRATYNTDKVIRETLIKKQSMSCKYVPVQTAGLSFEVGGEYIDEIFVQTGSFVEAGELLAQLRLEDMLEQIKNVKLQIEEINLRLGHLDALEDIALRRCEIEEGSQGLAALRKAQDQVKEDFIGRRKSYEDSLTLKQITLETLEEKLAQRQIYAPFTGTVTYVRKYDDGARSVKGERILTLSDSTMSIFRMETEYWHHFRPGDEVEITVSKQNYVAIVASEEELGLPVTEKKEGKKAVVYLRLKEPAFDLEDGDAGRFDLILQVWEDVLTVPSTAVSSAGDQPIVYYVRQDGTRGYKTIEIGETVNRRTIVLSGLEEGDEIIVK